FSCQKSTSTTLPRSDLRSIAWPSRSSPASSGAGALRCTLDEGPKESNFPQPANAAARTRATNLCEVARIFAPWLVIPTNDATPGSGCGHEDFAVLLQAQPPGTNAHRPYSGAYLARR